ncbi:MAG: glycoside hydrolase family 95 protein, partial [Candidatus Symbiothrix sp.]|nr:glycoside hydrolase family 95 protein [Candidatus Symbiothrix sp.]
CDNPGGGEKFPMLFDGSPNTKWFADTGFKGFPCYIAWEYDNAFPVSAYTLISGNDMPARDPKAWNLYGSANGTDYTLIDARTGITFPARNQSLSFTLSQTAAYKYFKLEITATFTDNTPPQLSEISLENAAAATFPEYTDYHRELDIDRAVSTVTYTQNGVNYTREYFISHPDRVMLIRLTADKPGSLSRNIWITSPQENRTIRADEGVITMEGQPSGHRETGLKFALQLNVIPSGGSMSAANGRIKVENADEILIISSAATNYQQCMDETYNYFSATDPLVTVRETIQAAARKSRQQLLDSHIADYQSLYDRMELQLGSAGNANNKTAGRLLSGYRNNTNTDAENRYLEQLYYQFGRYLLIASSRNTGLPANLQGIWAEGLAPPWAADYHTNINIQMNYWLAEQTNLADCHRPAIDFVKSLVPRGRYTAQHYFCKQDGSPVRGWVDFHENNIWGNTGPAESDAFYFPAAAGWLCQDIWEYYLFNQDRAFLEEYYPVLLEAALFWVDNLWRDARDGTLVAAPSYSPEHGPYSFGSSCDQAIITELFDMTLKASRILNQNTAEIDEIIAAKEKLAGPQIGLAGQFMEWKDETSLDISGDGGHRHVNHLFWLHPGSQIIPGRSPQEDLYAEAMKKTLNTRGDGGTGWSKAWKINFWARLRDGNHSYRLLGELLKESTLDNLFDTHPPFQIDGNFGATAGITEMLIQSQGDAIEILPALPDVWPRGNFRGIKARGNFELAAQWETGNLASMEIISHSGNTCIIKYKAISAFTVRNRNGGTVAPTLINENTVRFETEKGNTYILEKQ